jgi:hypothetical protein
MQSILGFGLVLFSVILLAGIGGGIDMIPPDAGFVEWLSIACLAIGALAAGLLGVSFINEGE